MRPHAGQPADLALPPEVHQLAQTIIHRARRGRISGCPHLDRHPTALVCLMHPTTLRCPSCHLRHSERHTEAEEYGCDVCGAHMPDTVDLSLFVTHPAEIDALVPIGRGRFAAVGYVVVGGWGACPEHFREMTP